ncbi:ABC transporter permease [Snuella lapsa]|uniref:ABC transporter permease n=1 Tax=Snuella lapsa TaxID=870481 RepID=A0ABP6WWU0_9FLAO
MFDLDLWREIFQSINKNRTRSLLSGFTVAFAILLFAVLFGIANGLKNTFKERFGNRTTNAIYLYAGKTSMAYQGLQAGRRIQFKNSDTEYLSQTYSDKLEYVLPVVRKGVTGFFAGNKNNYTLSGVNPDNQFFENTKIISGRYINAIDLQNKKKVIVIGKLVKDDLFLNKEALGKYITLGGIQYKVVGVCENENDYLNRAIYTPITTVQQVYGNTNYVDQINLTYDPKMSYDEAIALINTIRKKLKERFLIAPNDQRGIYVSSLADDFKEVGKMNLVLSIVILIIGLGTLIAGVVGISNIMIFVVKERTKEIGIRKALGASPRSIVSIILIESILVTTIAGYMGLLIGMGILESAKSSLEAYFIKDPAVSTSLVITATITLIIAGAIAGYFPARKASRIKPIVALRND